MDSSEKTLIDRTLKGDREAFGTMIRRWERQVLNLAYRLTGDEHEALDIRQNAFVKAYQGLPAFNGEARFSTWLYRIVVNLCRDRMRARSSRDAAHRGLRGLPGAREAPSPEHVSQRKETARLVAEAVGALPEPVREVLVLKHYHEQSFSEIAAILGTPASTVKSRMAWGLKALKAQLKDLEP